MSFIDKTIWGRGAIPPTEMRFRGIVRVVLPMIDICVIIFALIHALYSPLAALASVTDASFAKNWAILLGMGSVFALVGLSFPKLWAFELAGRLAYLGCLIAYFSLFLKMVILDLDPFAGFILSLTLLWLPIWRATDIGFVWFKRKNNTKEK